MQKTHIVGHRDFERELQKYIHGEKIDIGLGNHLNPRGSSK